MAPRGGLADHRLDEQPQEEVKLAESAGTR